MNFDVCYETKPSGSSMRPRRLFEDRKASLRRARARFKLPWRVRLGQVVSCSSHRCSFEHRLEVYATEFEIQGLELDWIGLCWGGDLIWSNDQERWICRSFRNGSRSHWSPIGKSEVQANLSQKLLPCAPYQSKTRAYYLCPYRRPRRSHERPRRVRNAANFLTCCGVRLIDYTKGSPDLMPVSTLFETA